MSSYRQDAEPWAIGPHEDSRPFGAVVVAIARGDSTRAAAVPRKSCHTSWILFTGNGSGHWSLSIERAYLPSVATNVTFQFTQPRGGTTVSRSFAYDPGAGGATSQGPMAPGPSGAVLRQVQFGADVIFSGIAAPGTSVVLLPSYTVTSVLMSSQSVPTGVL